MDFGAITPNHFLALETLTFLSEPYLDTVPVSKLKRWCPVTDIINTFKLGVERTFF